MSVPGRIGVPRRRDLGREVVAQGADEIEAQPSSARFGQRRDERVPGHTARDHPRVLRVHPAERDHEVRVFEDVGPGGRPVPDVGEPRDVGQQHLGSGQRIGVDRRRVATDAVQEPVQLALGVVEPTGAGPAVGTAEDRRVAVGVAYPPQLGRRPVERLVPRDLDVAVAPATVIGPGTVVEPAPADRGPSHAAAAQAVAQVGVERRRRRIVGVFVDRHDLVVRHGDAECSPVRHVRKRARLGHRQSLTIAPQPSLPRSPDIQSP